MHRNESDVVTQAKVVDLLSKSHLPQPILAQIWALSAQGRIEIPKEDFFDLIRYVALAQEQMELTVVNLCKEGPRIPRFAGIPTPAMPSPTTAKRQFNTASAKKQDLAWVMSREQIDFYENTRRALDTKGLGMVDGSIASPIFLKSGLTTHELKEIWQLADSRQVGALNRAQFHVAMHLIMMRMNQGRPIPKQLPGPLLAHVAHFEAMAAKDQPAGPAPGGIPLVPVSASVPPSAPASSQAHPTPTPVTASSTITEELYKVDASSEQFYLHTFHLVDTDNDGEITALEARDLLAKSELPQEELMHIWNLSDTRRRGRLSRAEFIAAMHIIIVRKKHHAPLPASLPAPLQSLITTESLAPAGGLPRFSPEPTFSAPSPTPAFESLATHIQQPSPASNANPYHVSFEDTARTVASMIERGESASISVPAASSNNTSATVSSLLNFDSQSEHLVHQPPATSGPLPPKKPSALPTNLDDAIMSTFVASVGVMSAALNKQAAPAPVSVTASTQLPTSTPTQHNSFEFGLDSTQNATASSGFGDGLGFSADFGATHTSSPAFPKDTTHAAPSQPTAFAANFDNDMFSQPTSFASSTFNQQQSSFPAPATSSTSSFGQVDSTEILGLKRQIEASQQTFSQQQQELGRLQSLVQSLSQKLDQVISAQQTQQRQIDELKRPVAAPAPAISFFDDVPPPIIAPASAPTANITQFSSASQPAAFSAFGDSNMFGTSSFDKPAVAPTQSAQSQTQTQATQSSKRNNVVDFLQSDFGDDDQDMMAPTPSKTTAPPPSSSGFFGSGFADSGFSDSFKSTTATTTAPPTLVVTSLFDASLAPVSTSVSAPISRVAPPAVPARSRVGASSLTSTTNTTSTPALALVASIQTSVPTQVPSSSPTLPSLSPTMLSSVAATSTNTPASLFSTAAPHVPASSVSSNLRPPSPQPLYQTPQLPKDTVKHAESDDDDDGEVSAFGFGETVHVQDKTPVSSTRIRAASLLARDVADPSMVETAAKTRGAQDADFDSFGKANNPFESASFGFDASSGFDTSNPFSGAFGASHAEIPKPTAPTETSTSTASTAPTSSAFGGEGFGAANFGSSPSGFTDTEFGSHATTTSGFGAPDFGDASPFGESDTFGSSSTFGTSNPVTAPSASESQLAQAAAPASTFDTVGSTGSGFDNSFDSAFAGFGDSFGATPPVSTTTPAPELHQAQAQPPTPAATPGFDAPDFDQAFSGFGDSFGN